MRSKPAKFRAHDSDWEGWQHPIPAKVEPAVKDIRQASPREQARWLRDRGWFTTFDGRWYYGAKYFTWGVGFTAAIDIELSAETLRRKRASKRGVK